MGTKHSDGEGWDAAWKCLLVHSVVALAFGSRRGTHFEWARRMIRECGQESSEIKTCQ